MAQSDLEQYKDAKDKVTTNEMEENTIPKLIPHTFVDRLMTARQTKLIESYNWKFTPEGLLRMDKKPPSTPRKNLPPLKFSGQCFDEEDNVWTTCFEIEEDGTIGSKDTYFHKVRSVAGNVEIGLDEVCLFVLFWLSAVFPENLTSDRLWALSPMLVKQRVSSPSLVIMRRRDCLVSSLPIGSFSLVLTFKARQLVRKH